VQLEAFSPPTPGPLYTPQALVLQKVENTDWQESALKSLHESVAEARRRVALKRRKQVRCSRAPWLL